MPSGTHSGKGLYFTVYPLSRPNMDTVNHFQGSRKQDPVDSMGSDKTYLVRLETTHIRLNKLTADGPNCCENMTKINLAQSIIWSNWMGICPTLRLVPNILCDLVFKKITVRHYFGYFV